jgi:uracil-DNA glycosylase family 4
VSDDGNNDLERRSLIRTVRQELESLGRAGLDRVPAWKSEDSSKRDQSLHAQPNDAPGRSADPGVGNDDSHPRSVPAKPASPPALPPAVANPVTPTSTRERPSRVLPSPPSAPLFGAPEFETPAVPPCDRQAILDSLAAEVSVCQKCPNLAATRTQTVFGVGSNVARLMFVGEAPGADEDRLGKPFVGRAGQLLTDMITKGMGLSRDQVYIANVLKCRPPDNRPPTIEEAVNCRGYLEQQVAVVRPEFLCLLGRTAASTLLETTLSMGMLRGKWHRYREIPTLVTYHPSYLLRTPSAKKDAWEDLQILMKEMGLKLPSRR